MSWQDFAVLAVAVVAAGLLIWRRRPSAKTPGCEKCVGEESLLSKKSEVRSQK
jgi:hypothetical protein